MLACAANKSRVWLCGWRTGGVHKCCCCGARRDRLALAYSGSASEGIGGARGLGNLVRPESHPEPHAVSRSVQWAATR